MQKIDLSLELAKEFNITDYQGKFPKVWDYALNVHNQKPNVLQAYIIKFWVYEQEVCDYWVEPFDWCWFYLESVRDSQYVSGLWKNSKDFVFISENEYKKLLEQYKR